MTARFVARNNLASRRARQPAGFNAIRIPSVTPTMINRVLMFAGSCVYCTRLDGVEVNLELRNNARRSPLQDFYTDASVPVNGANNLIIDTERSEECFEGSKFVEWSGELVKENKIARFQMRSHGR
jgi:hypothetical protein